MGCQSCEERRAKLEQAKHFAQSAGRVVKAAVTGEQVIATKAQQSERESYCEKCDKVKRMQPFLPVGSTICIGDTCKECGCDIKRKVMFATESCPLGKWMEIKNG